ncbi:PREDICTED: uncharacterized protein LOC107064049 isoform X2 [Polistes dominula]|uniref:Uncharacterized protein LOC107064049 isoform X2 n=1 Tax=Polistes dominula TaxID=743375 RepID=A0ABM1HV01_POLDO|nr:PREDICTED: uncharacterized protein LOC107064049 isoform X2 [Polistes dominula]
MIVYFCMLIVNLQQIRGHGMMLDPINRSSAWRKNLPVPRNYLDNQHFCGGFQIQYQQNNGHCGECGDDWSLPRPRPNENGGIYGTGLIVKEYIEGSYIQIQIELTASHLGHFEFSICPLNNKKELETDECFAKYPIRLANGSYKYNITSYAIKDYTIEAVLPQGLTCEHCVLRWHYRAGNNWGICEDGSGDIGCGNQENFRSCSDISIF